MYHVAAKIQPNIYQINMWPCQIELDIKILEKA